MSVQLSLEKCMKRVNSKKAPLVQTELVLAEENTRLLPWAKWHQIPAKTPKWCSSLREMGGGGEREGAPKLCLRLQGPPSGTENQN